jgi:hypothetical protein
VADVTDRTASLSEKPPETVVRVFISSPSDVEHEADAVDAAISEWNRAGRAVREHITLLPMRWNVDAITGTDGPAQEQIDTQLMDEADIVIALFRARIGTPVDGQPSGTAHEIERARGRGAPTHVYFARYVPRDHDPEQFRLVREYEHALQKQALTGVFDGIDDLTKKVRQALDRDVVLLKPPWEPAQPERPLLLSLPGDAVDRVLRRVKATLERQSGIVGVDITKDLTVYRSKTPGYWQYDLRSESQYVVEQAVTPKLCIAVLAHQLISLDSPSPPVVVQRTDCDWRDWRSAYWPPLADIAHWSSFADGIEIEVEQFQSRRPRQRRSVEVDRADSVGDDRNPVLEFSGDLEVDPDWNSLTVTLRGLPHPKSLRSMHFYAGDVCTGTLRFTARGTGDQPPELRVTTISSPDVTVRREVIGRRAVSAHFGAQDVAILPDDAVLISINDAG